MDVHHLKLPDHHQEAARRFIEACQADDRIVAAFLGGSYAGHETDRYSDLDFFFITTDEAYQEFLAEKEKFALRLGEPVFLEDFGVAHGYLFILSDGTEGEFWFGHESQFQNIYSGPIKVLLDKKHILDDVDFPPRPADPAERREMLQRQIYGFWHELSHFIKAMGRKQLWFAAGELEAMRAIDVVLARLKHNFLDPFLDEGEPYFKIEGSLPVEKLTPLPATYCAMEYEGLYQSAQAICRFYVETAPGLAAEHDLTYPVELERIYRKNLNELGTMSDW